MKKLLFFCSALCLMLFAACSSNTPSAVAEKAFGYMVDQDAESFVDLIYTDEDASAEEVKMGKDILVATFKAAFAKQKEELDEVKSYKAVKEEINEDGKRASVTLEVETKDGSKEEEHFDLRKNKDGDWKIDFTK